MNARELLPPEDGELLDEIEQHRSLLGLVDPGPLPAHAPIPFVPVLSTRWRRYGLLVDPGPLPVWRGQVHELADPKQDFGYVGSVAVGIRGLLLHIYFEQELGDDAADVIEPLVGGRVPRRSAGRFSARVRRFTRESLGIPSATAVLVRRLAFCTDPELATEVQRLAPAEGEAWLMPLLARGFHVLGWTWAEDLCRQREPTDQQKARWPFTLEEATAPLDGDGAG